MHGMSHPGMPRSMRLRSQRLKEREHEWVGAGRNGGNVW